MASFIIITAVFLTVLLLSKWMNLGYCLVIGSFMLLLLSGAGFAGVSEVFSLLISDRSSFELLAAIMLVFVLSESLRTGGQLERLVGVARRIFHDLRLTAFVLPALVGLLPMPGGAHFSAPMVDSVFSGLPISSERKAFANYWFRHVWEYINPIYPGIVAMLAMTGLPPGRVMAVNSILTLTAILAGMVIIFYRKIEVEKRRYAGDARGVLLFVRELSPVIAVILPAAVFNLHIVPALFCGLAVSFIMNRSGPAAVIKTFRDGFNPQIMIMLVGIIVFKNTVSGSGIVSRIAVYMAENEIGALPVIFSLSFLSGFVTGITIAFIGTSLPIIMTILEDVNPWNMMFVFASGFAGVLLSPVHMCLVLSNQYFRASFRGVYRYLVPATAAVAAAGFAGYLLWG